MTTTAYPLCWPAGWKRTPASRQTKAKFSRATPTSGGARSLTLTEGVMRVMVELQRMGIDQQDVIVSTGVRTRLDGLPRAGEREPDDAGAAVYWQDHKGHRRVMAIDIYNRVADNLAAVAATLEALRSIERHGGAAILDRAFTGFAALPAPTAKRAWREVLGIDELAVFVDAETLKEAYRRKTAAAHPDKPGGSESAMAEVNVAYAEAKKEQAELNR